MKDNKTNAMRILEKAGIGYNAHFYESDEDPCGTSDYGAHIAAQLGVDPLSVFKTLVAKGATGAYYVFELPVEGNLDLKSAARAVGEKSVEMLKVAQINAVTGYVRGGCSPLGMKKQYVTVFDETALLSETIYVSAGKIGAQLEIAPQDLINAVNGKVAAILRKSE